VIAGFVENRKVRFGYQDPCERHPPAIPAAERIDRRVQLAQPDVSEDRIHLMHPIPPTQALHVRRRSRLPLDQLREVPIAPSDGFREVLVPGPGLVPFGEAAHHDLPGRSRGG